ncbi:MAG TPA: methyltransferase domain-containing protein [Burkholderiales bacterium]|nr:methyltransferase domain-containing protein [Burkholderiales bacterium]
MLERLDYVRMAPRRILDAGSGAGRDARKLHERFRGASLVRLDFSPALLRAGRARFFEKSLFACGDLARLPFAGASFDLVWSNMALHWAPDAPHVLREFARVAAPDALVMFATLGPDTLKELRAAAGATRVHQFIDMHDLGDMLVEAGFSAPVMDMEMLTFEYRERRALLSDLRRSGQTNARSDRLRGLSGRGFMQRLVERLGASASFEVVYGHAWKGAPRRLADGRDVVRFHAPREK